MLSYLEGSNAVTKILAWHCDLLRSEHLTKDTQSSTDDLSAPTINHELAVRLAKLHTTLAEIRITYKASRKLIELMHQRHSRYNGFDTHHPVNQEYIRTTRWRNNHFEALIRTMDRDGAYFNLPDAPFDILVSTIENSGITLRIPPAMLCDRGSSRRKGRRGTGAADMRSISILRHREIIYR